MNDVFKHKEYFTGKWLIAQKIDQEAFYYMTRQNFISTLFFYFHLSYECGFERFLIGYKVRRNSLSIWSWWWSIRRNLIFYSLKKIFKGSSADRWTNWIMNLISLMFFIFLIFTGFFDILHNMSLQICLCK